MKHSVSFSGGRTSAYLVYLMEQKRINEGWDVEYVFMDTGAEHPKTYEFIRNMVKYWGVDIKVIKAVVHPEKGKGNTYNEISIDEMGWNLSLMSDVVKKYGGFTINRPWCTSKLKTVTSDKYRIDKYSKNGCYIWLGIRADEPGRIRFVNENVDFYEKNNGNEQNIHYLAEISDFTKQDILDWWKLQPFDLEIEEHLGNCIFCIKKSDLKIAAAERDEPEKFKEWTSVMTSSDVRLMPADKHGIGHIYRKWLTPNQLIAQFADLTDYELKSRMRTFNKFDAGGCSESCEVFSK